MGQNGLRDVIQASMRLVGQAAEFATPFAQERAVSELRTAKLSLEKDANDFLTELSTSPDFESYDTEWENKKIELYNNASKLVTTNYGRENLAAMYEELAVTQGFKIQALKQKKEGEWTLVNNQNYRNEINTSSGYTPEEKYQITASTILEEYQSGLIGYAEYDQKIRENAATNAMTVLLANGRAAMEGLNLDAALAAVDENQYQIVLPGGKNLPMDGIKEAVKKTLENDWNTSVKAMQAEHAGSLSEIYGSMLASGNKEYAYKGLAQIEKWTGYNLDKNERDEYAKRFSDFLKEKDPDKASKAALEDMITLEFEKALRLTFQGEKNKNDPNRGFVNAETGKAAFQTVAEKILNDPKNRDEDGRVNPGAWEKYEKLKNEFYGEIEKRLPVNNPAIATKYTSIKKKSEDIALKRFGAKKLADLTETQRTEYDNLQSYVDGAMWDYLMSTNMATTTPEQADAVFENILTATLAKEMDILKKNPTTGESGYQRGFMQSEDALAADYIKKAENPDLAYKDTFGNERWVPGVKEGAAEFQNWARGQISKVVGVDPSEITPSFLETKGGQDVDAVSVFTARGKQYKYTVADGKPVLNEKTSNGDWRAVQIGTAAQKTAAKKQQEKGVYDSKTGTADDFLEKNRDRLYSTPAPDYTPEQWLNKSESERFTILNDWITKDPDGFMAWAKPKTTTTQGTVKIPGGAR